MDLITAKLAFVILAALGLGLWQLWDINRELKKEETKAEKPRSTDIAEEQKQRGAITKSTNSKD